MGIYIYIYYCYIYICGGFLKWSTSKSSIYRWFFHEINHPAIYWGTTHICGNIIEQWLGFFSGNVTYYQRIDILKGAVQRWNSGNSGFIGSEIHHVTSRSIPWEEMLIQLVGEFLKIPHFDAVKRFHSMDGLLPQHIEGFTQPIVPACFPAGKPASVGRFWQHQWSIVFPNG